MTREEAKEYLYDIVDMIGTMGIEDLTEKDAEKALTAIDTLADVPETNVGKWIYHPEIKNIYGGKCIECSECGEKYMVVYIEDEKYCRNCGSYNGAKMKREQKHLGNKSDLVILDEVTYE